MFVRSTRCNFVSALGEPKDTMNNMMDDSPSYEAKKPQEFAGVEMYTAAAIRNRMLHETAVQEALRSQAACTELLKDQQKVMKTELRMEQLSRDTRIDTSPWLVDQGVLT